MRLFNVLMNYGKARMATRILGRAAGGNVFMMMLMGYLGKKAYNRYVLNRSRNRVRAY